MKSKTVNEQLEELNKLIGWFDSDKFEIELALEKLKQANELAENIEEKLNKIENEITIVKKKFDNTK